MILPPVLLVLPDPEKLVILPLARLLILSLLSALLSLDLLPGLLVRLPLAVELLSHPPLPPLTLILPPGLMALWLLVVPPPLDCPALPTLFLRALAEL